MSKTTWGLVGLVAVLVACGGSPEADEAPTYGTEESTQTDAGQRDNGAEPASPGSENGKPTSGEREPAASTNSIECRLQGPYRLTALGCGNSADYDAGAITGFDSESCSLNVSIGGMHSVRVECEPGDPVTDCVGATTNDSGCIVEWTMYPAE